LEVSQKLVEGIDGSRDLRAPGTGPAERAHALGQCGTRSESGAVYEAILAGLRILQLEQARGHGLGLERVVDQEAADLVSAREYCQGLLPGTALMALEVRQDADHSPSLQQVTGALEHSREVCSSMASLVLEGRADDRPCVSTGSTRRKIVFDPIREREQADAVSVPNPCIGQGASEPRDLKPLVGSPVAPAAAEAHRAGHVQHEQEIQLSFFSKLLYEWLLRACGHIPVDMPNVIAWNIRSDLLEFHALSAERAPVLARERTVYFPVQLNLQRTNLADLIGGKGHGVLGKVQGVGRS